MRISFRPEAFAYAAAQVKNALDATHRLGGANYVLWGGREGYETLLNTRIRQEGDQFEQMVHDDTICIHREMRAMFLGASAKWNDNNR